MHDEHDPLEGDTPIESRDSRAASADDYEVGYKRPPKHSQFKPGQSGNPKGRSKGSANFKTDLLATLNMLTAITQDGVSRKISTQRAVLMRLRDGALRGKGRELVTFLGLAQIYNDDAVVRQDAVRTIEDQAILDAFLTRSREGTPAEPAAGETADGENHDDT